MMVLFLKALAILMQQGTRKGPGGVKYNIEEGVLVSDRDKNNNDVCVWGRSSRVNVRENVDLKDWVEMRPFLNKRRCGRFGVTYANLHQ